MKLSKALVDLGCAVFCLVATASGFAQSDTQFAKANQEYAEGKFNETVADYESLVRSGETNANLFYDLGNAYFRTGNFGPAILNYERALALNPRHPEANANLQIVQDEARALELPQGRLERLLGHATANQYAIAAAIAFWVGAFCLAALLFARRRTAGRVALSILSLSIFAFCAGAVFLSEKENQTRAIVIGNEVQARVATADSANSVLALPPGSELRILSRRGDWIYAALPNNLRGWLPAKSADRVRL
jgi:tetratricopeptide (TPR) repeat protein